MTSAKKPTTTTKHTKPPRTTLLPRWLSWALGVAFVITAVSVSSLAYLTASAYWDQPFNPLDEQDAVAIAAQSELLDIDSLLGGTGEENLPPAVLTEIVAESEPFVVPTLEATGRTNILVLGIDRRPGEPYMSRTDTMLILSLDPEENRAAMLSIPRDLYVTIPNYGQNRVNTAFVYGAQYGGGPAAGAELAMETVSYNLGVPIHHYLTVDFNTFVQAIDTLGGIDVDVPKIINDPFYPDMNYGYDPLYIPAGLQHFDGETALKYARTRHADSDFHRAERQQQVVMAVRERVLAQGVNGLLQQGPLLLNQFEEGVRTDLTPGQILALASAASQVPVESIEAAVLDSTYVSPYTTPGGASVLILQAHMVQPLVQSLFD